MFTKSIFAVAGAMFAFSVSAADMSGVEKSIALKDGTTVHIFKDGKMGMEDRLGNVVNMKQGHPMEARNGQRIIMVGDEVSRLHAALYAQWQ